MNVFKFTQALAATSLCLIAASSAFAAVAEQAIRSKVAGIDVIGPYLTEINVTSPTGIRQVKEFGGPDIAALIWDAIEAKAGSA